MKREDLAKAYNDVSLQIKILEAQRDNLRGMIRDIGGFSAGPWVVSVEDKTRRSLAGLAEVTDAIGEKVLEKHGLIRESTYQVIRVSAKKPKK